MKTDWKKPPREKKKKTYPKKNIRSKGEYLLFTHIYKELSGRSEVTGKYLPFNVKNFAHLLSKGSRPDLRLLRENIVHCEFEIHFSFDNDTKENTLKKFPNVEWMYDMKEQLKSFPVIKK